MNKPRGRETSRKYFDSRAVKLARYTQNRINTLPAVSLTIFQVSYSGQHSDDSGFTSDNSQMSTKLVNFSRQQICSRKFLKTHIRHCWQIHGRLFRPTFNTKTLHKTSIKLARNASKVFTLILSTN